MNKAKSNKNKSEAAILSLIENVMTGNKKAAKRDLQFIVNQHLGKQIKKVGNETLI